MHGHCYGRIPLVQSCGLQVLWAVGRVSLARQRWTHGQEDRLWCRTYRSLRQWSTICPRQCEVCLRSNSPEVEAPSSQHRCSLGNMVRVRSKHEHHQLLDRVRSAHLQLPALASGQYRVRSSGIGFAWVAMDLRPC